MARDYVARNRRPPPRPAGLPGWVWLVAGLSMGLVIATIVYIGRPPQPLPMSQQARTPTAAAAARPKVEIPPVETPRFDFYTLLEKEQVVVPVQEPELPQAAPAPAAPPPAVEPPETTVSIPAMSAPSGAQYLVVAGAFREADNAEEHKARLAFAGIESDIERITGQDRQIWHRVRSGPYNLSKAENLMAQLQANGFEGRVVKLP
ncbi:SPOR domain-containing protein [Panacagrimonas sp.]|uniref:SPOR domain-containing protein n=1 Tax=Panacagrimonas sp. TaxID=2480088 RepID=UPI003B52888A